MKVNVNVVSSINSTRVYSPNEVAALVRDYLGKKVVSDVPGSTLVSNLISVLVVQLGLVTTQATFVLQKGDVVLDNTKSLDQVGVKENDNLKFRVILTLS